MYARVYLSSYFVPSFPPTFSFSSSSSSLSSSSRSVCLSRGEVRRHEAHTENFISMTEFPLTYFTSVNPTWPKKCCSNFHKTNVIVWRSLAQPADDWLAAAAATMELKYYALPSRRMNAMIYSLVTTTM